LGLFGIVGGPILGVFILGLFFPRVEWKVKQFQSYVSMPNFLCFKGALSGQIIAEIASFWIGIGSHIYSTPAQKAPLSTEECPSFLNETNFENATISTMKPMVQEPFSGLAIYKISYLWQGVVAVLITVIVGVIVSYFSSEYSFSKVLHVTLMYSD